MARALNPSHVMFFDADDLLSNRIAGHVLNGVAFHHAGMLPTLKEVIDYDWVLRYRWFHAEGSEGI